MRACSAVERARYLRPCGTRPIRALETGIPERHCRLEAVLACAGFARPRASGASASAACDRPGAFALPGSIHMWVSEKSTERIARFAWVRGLRRAEFSRSGNSWSIVGYVGRKAGLRGVTKHIHPASRGRSGERWSRGPRPREGASRWALGRCGQAGGESITHGGGRRPRDGTLVPVLAAGLALEVGVLWVAEVAVELTGRDAQRLGRIGHAVVGAGHGGPHQRLGGIGVEYT